MKSSGSVTTHSPVSYPQLLWFLLRDLQTEPALGRDSQSPQHCLTTNEHLLSGAILQTQCIFDHGALPCLLNPLTRSHKENIRKEASLRSSAFCPSLVKPPEYMPENLTLYSAWGLEIGSLWEFLGDPEVRCCLLSPAAFDDLEKGQNSPKFSCSVQRGTKSEMSDFVPENSI
ncbi:hypothetical protein AAG906_016978 [Vitis piasezkii]